MVYVYIVRVISALIPFKNYRKKFRRYMRVLPNRHYYGIFCKACRLDILGIKFNQAIDADITISTKDMRSAYLFKTKRVLSYDVRIDKGCTVQEGVIIGNYTYISKRTVVWEDVQIGRYCSISVGCSIGVGNHYMDRLTTSPFIDFDKQLNEKCNHEKNSVKTVIGNDVWIGVNVVIKAGVTVGDGAVIGAGAVVTKNVPDYAIVAGVPAKVIRYRFNSNQIEKLKETRWWELEPDTLKQLHFENIDLCIDELINLRLGVIKN